MADYQRFVSYLYEYQNNIKSKNCGFCRVELRDHNCRLEIHLKLPIYPFTPTLNVYVFVPSKEKLYGIFVGNASYHQGNVSGIFSFTERNIKNSPYHFSQLGGIFIQSDIGICFASAWKDLNIQPDNFISPQNSTFPEKSTEQFSEPTKKNTVHTKETKNECCLPNPDAEITLDKPQIESDQPNVEAPSAVSIETENLSCTASQETSIPNTSETRRANITEETSEPNNAQEHKQNLEQKSEQCTEQESEITVEHEISKESEKETSQVREPALHTEKYNAHVLEPQINSENPKEPSAVCEEPESALLAASTDSSDNFWEVILKSYPQCHPFFDDEIHNCVQLSPKDVQKISASGYPICNNAFFRHNCQSFQHFLIGRKDCNCGVCNTHYILAVPGIYNPKEQYMASMFGFPYFKCSQNARCRNNCWGYWYRIIPEHWNECRF